MEKIAYTTKHEKRRAENAKRLDFNKQNFYVKLSEIHINPRNPRFITKEMFEKLMNSIREFPRMMELNPLVINEENVIQGGNMRYRALKKLGYKEIPDEWVKQGKDLTPEQWRKFVVLDNVSFGDWDMDLLSEAYDLQELQDMGLTGLDFSIQIDKTLEAKDDFYEIPDEVTTDIRLGDLFEIGPHRLMCGDATKQADVQALMAGRHADLAITDPPYNVNYSEDRKILNDDMSDQKFFNFLFEFYRQMLDSLKAGGSFYIFHANANASGYNFYKALLENGVTPRQCLIWVKDTLVLGRQDYHWRHEPILYGWKPGAAHYFTEDRSLTTVIDKEINLGKMTKDEMRELLEQILDRKNYTTAIYADRPKRSELHPTMKPIPLVGYLMKNSSRVGDTIQDLFIGSGTTMVTAHQLKRRCYGLELDPAYCEIILDRMQKLEPGIEITKNGKAYDKTPVMTLSTAS